MWLYFRLFLFALRLLRHDRRDLVLENLALRQQLAVFDRRRRRPSLAWTRRMMRDWRNGRATAHSPLVQALEGDIDTSHATLLHFGALDPADLPEGSWARYGVMDRAPKHSVVDMPYGTCYGAYRPAGPDHHYWRIASFLFPFWTMVPVNTPGGQAMARAWVPIDDEHTIQPEDLSVG